MGWSIGWDSNWTRDIGYGVPATCDYPDCGAKINRGLGYVCCGSEPYGGDGCGLYFCERHRSQWSDRLDHFCCERCAKEEEPFDPTPDVPEWINHKLTDESWEQWRKENPEEVERLKSAEQHGDEL